MVKRINLKKPLADTLKETLKEARQNNTRPTGDKVFESGDTAVFTGENGDTAIISNGDITYVGDTVPPVPGGITASGTMSVVTVTWSGAFADPAETVPADWSHIEVWADGIRKGEIYGSARNSMSFESTPGTTHSIVTYAVDKAGNRSEGSAPVSVTVESVLGTEWGETLQGELDAAEGRITTTEGALTDTQEALDQAKIDLAADATSKANAAKDAALQADIAVKAIADQAKADAEAAQRMAQDAARSADNLIVNGSFEQDLTGWSRENQHGSVVTDTAYDGTKSFMTTGLGGLWQPAIPVTVGETYRFEWFYKTEAGYSTSLSGGLRLQTSTDGISFTNTVSSTLTENLTWTKQSVDYKVPANVTHIRPRIAFNYATGAGPKAWMDSVRLTNVTSIVKLEADAKAALDRAVLAESNAITAASTDATTKANKALSDAKAADEAVKAIADQAKADALAAQKAAQAAATNAENMLYDGGFEFGANGKELVTGSSGSGIVEDAAVSHSGTHSFKLIRTLVSPYPGARWRVQLQPERTYRVSFWAMAPTTATTSQSFYSRVELASSGANGGWKATTKTFPNDGIWREYSYDVNTAGAWDLSTVKALWLQASGAQDDPNAVAYIDDVSFRDYTNVLALEKAASDAAQAAVDAEANAKAEAKRLADLAQAAAIEAASIDATQKADEAERLAKEAAALDAAAQVELAEQRAATEAARIAGVKAEEARIAAENAAKTYADTQASGASADAIEAANLEAKRLADEAQRLATEAARLDAEAQVEAAEGRAATEAARVATEKANAAQQAAIDAAAITAQAKADAAKQAAIDAAKLDATAKADAAEQAAIDAASLDTNNKVAQAKLDAATEATNIAQTKADQAEADAVAAAKTHADLVAGNAETAAINAAAITAQTKADEAKRLAIEAAELDASEKATAAQTAAINAAATNAANEAEAARLAAISAASTDASTKAENARLAAIEADKEVIALANGKNTITNTTVDPNVLGKAVGDIWFRRGADNIVIGEWEWRGGTSVTGWVKRTIGNQVIANLDAGKINAGTINSARIGAESITASKLTLTDTNNLWADPDFLDGTISNSTVYTGTEETVPNGRKALLVNRRDHTSTRRVKVHPGDAYRFYFTGKPLTGTARFKIALWYTRADKTDGRTSTPSWYYYSSLGHGSLISLVKDMGNGWGRYTSTLTIPDNLLDIAYGQLYFQIEQYDPWATSWLISDFEWRKMSGGELIVDGAITATKIDALAINSGHLTTDAVTAEKIKSGAVTAEKITVTDTLAANIVNSMTSQTKHLVVTDEAILNRATVIGGIAADEVEAASIKTTQLVAGTGTMDSLAAGQVSSAIVQAGIKTSEGTVNGVTLDASGLTAKDGSGNTTVRIGSDGSATFTGAVNVTSGTVPASTVSGTLAEGNVPTLDPAKVSGLTATKITNYDTASTRVTGWTKSGATTIDGAKIAATSIAGTQLNATSVGTELVSKGAIQTTTTAARGVKITTAGITAYDGTGAETVKIGTDGSAFFKGTIQAGSTVPAGVLSGTLDAARIPTLDQAKVTGLTDLSSTVSGHGTSIGTINGSLSTLSGTVTSHDQKLAQWASANDTTLIDGAKIYTGSITADKISLGATANMVPGGMGDDTTGWTGWTFEPVPENDKAFLQGSPETYYVLKNQESGSSPRFDIAGTSKFLLSFGAKSEDAGNKFNVAIQYYDISGSYFSGQGWENLSLPNAGNVYNTSIPDVQVPTNAVTAQIRVWLNEGAASYPTNKKLYLTSFNVSTGSETRLTASGLVGYNGGTETMRLNGDNNLLIGDFLTGRPGEEPYIKMSSRTATGAMDFYPGPNGAYQHGAIWWQDGSTSGTTGQLNLYAINDTDNNRRSGLVLNGDGYLKIDGMVSPDSTAVKRGRYTLSNQLGAAGGTTNYVTKLRLNFPVAFPSGTVPVVIPAIETVNAAEVKVNLSGVNNTGFEVTLVNDAPRSTGTIQVHWVAFRM